MVSDWPVIGDEIVHLKRKMGDLRMLLRDLMTLLRDLMVLLRDRRMLLGEVDRLVLLLLMISMLVLLIYFLPVMRGVTSKRILALKLRLFDGLCHNKNLTSVTHICLEMITRPCATSKLIMDAKDIRRGRAIRLKVSDQVFRMVGSGVYVRRHCCFCVC